MEHLLSAALAIFFMAVPPADSDLPFRCLRHLAEGRELQSMRAAKTPEAKREFVEKFWSTRDPRPETPVNEARIVYEEKCREAERLFGPADSGAMGERGRYYILLGEPDERETTRDPVGRSVTYAGEHRVEDYERWIYYKIPNIGRLEVGFVRLHNSTQYRLASEVDLLQGIGRSTFESRALGASMQESRAIQEAVTPDAVEEAAPPPKPPARDALIEELGKKVAAEPRADFLFDVHTITLKAAEEGESSLLLTLRAKPADVSAQPIPEWEMHAMAAVKARADEDDEAPPADPFASAPAEPAAGEGEAIVEVIPYARNASLKSAQYYQLALRLAPGTYDVAAGLAHEKSGKVSVKRLEVNVPSFDPPYPKVSEPIVTLGGVREVADADLAAYRGKGGVMPLVVGDEHLIIPRFNHSFSKKSRENLTVYLQVYNPRSDGGAGNAPYAVEIVRSLRMNEPGIEGGVRTEFTRGKPESMQGGTGNAWWFETPAELLQHPKYYRGTYRYEIIVKDAADPTKKASTIFEFELTD
jgi:GWxTD domain-containing protein